jgi:hypothetical protein
LFLYMRQRIRHSVTSIMGSMYSKVIVCFTSTGYFISSYTLLTS